jgi:hypothetical protein
MVDGLSTRQDRAGRSRYHRRFAWSTCFALRGMFNRLSLRP